MNVCSSVNYGCALCVLQKGHKKIEIYVCACVERVGRRDKRKEKGVIERVG